MSLSLTFVVVIQKQMFTGVFDNYFQKRPNSRCYNNWERVRQECFETVRMVIVIRVCHVRQLEDRM